LAHISLDEHFIIFYEWCISVSIPLIILSGGLTPIIQALLSRAIGHELRGVEIVANSVVVREGFRSVNDEGGAWRVQFHDDSIYGHDKASTIRPYAKHREGMPKDERPILLYAGDGVSDMSAAKETDLLFAKQGEGMSSL
jgi:2,3-diketo-5-methylthio-1-phosphopentane phosphatase